MNCTVDIPYHIPVPSSHRYYELPLLEILHKRNGILFEVGQAAINGLWVIIWSSLLLGSFVQPLLQVVVCAGQENNQVRSAYLPGEKRHVNDQAF